MTVTQAIYDVATRAYVSRPFRYVSRPLLPGRQLDEDIEIYLACTARCGLMPRALNWLLMGEAAEQLFLRRAATREEGIAFQNEVRRRHTEIGAATDAIIIRVAALATGNRAGARRLWYPTIPELCAGMALLVALPAGVTLVADTALPVGLFPEAHARRCDYHLRSRTHEGYLEVAGMIDSAGHPPTFQAVGYAARMLNRPEIYAARGLPRPLILYADEVLDRVRLAGIIAGFLAPFV